MKKSGRKEEMVMFMLEHIVWGGDKSYENNSR